MSGARRPLIAGNWKMNKDHIEAIALVQKLAWTLKDDRHDPAKVEVAVIPPFTDLRSVQTLIAGDKLDLSYGAQDLSAHSSGAYTGEISGGFLSRLGATYVLVGHSERREHHGETDALVHDKLVRALSYDLVPILCAGETLEVRQAGRHIDHTLAQIDAAVEGVDSASIGDCVFAYEPVWAIGTGEVASAADAGEMASAIREHLRDRHGAGVAERARILYGGSAKADNIAEIMAQADVDGGLIGGASLDAESFAALVKNAVA